jgi:murein L,D-transpeptidase YcbB/YkuD
MRNAFPALCSLALLSGGVPAHASPVGDTAAVAPSTIANAIRSQAGTLGSFYAERNYAPLWFDGSRLSASGAALRALLQSAPVDGLAIDRSVLEQLDSLDSELGEMSPGALASAELTFAREFIRVANLMRQPSGSMQYLQPGLTPRPLAASELLRGAAGKSAGEYVQQMRWMHPQFRNLRAAMVRYQDRWLKLPQVTLPPSLKVQESASGAGVTLLRQRLGLAPGDQFNAELKVALQDFQADHGLSPDGVVGSSTIAALNTGSQDNLRVMRINLERARNLPGVDTRHVTVNAAAAELAYYEGGGLKGSMRVIVGTRATQTPEVSGYIHYVTFNPYWNVPVDLVRKNIAPSVAKGAPLKATYELLSDWNADARLIEASSVDWKAVLEGTEQVRLRQLPGPGNAMGRVKFNFANEVGIYLHDTPDKSLFNRPVRQLSNGCIRLEDASRVVEWLAGGQSATVDGGPEQHRPLPAPVPVYATYLTALATDRGVTFLKDVYGRDGVRPGQIAAR